MNMTLSVLQAELTFCAGDVITVFGEIDEDGFYYVSSLFTPSVCMVQTLHYSANAFSSVASI